MTKRAIDIVAATVGLGFLAAPLAAVALAIRLDSPGPVFYRGERVGRRGRKFRIFKFRSMYVRDVEGPGTSSATDSRVTRVGRILRRYKLDELPQLINVLRGDMSLVGPRPEVAWCVDLYTDEEQAILTVRPGITDWASIRFNDEAGIIAAAGYDDPDRAYLELIRPEKLRLQLKYVRERGLLTDLSILSKTLSTLFLTRTADVATTTARSVPFRVPEASA